MLYRSSHYPSYLFRRRGIHLLEMAKTAWNGIVISTGKDEEKHLQEGARYYLALSREVLTIFGPEGDEDGPLQEIETLQRLLRED
jgi:hypothetical protein